MTNPNYWFTLRRLTVSCCVWFLAPCVSFAADAEKKSFDLPADTAEQALKRFSAQAGLQVVFSPEVTDGVKTNAVKGEFTPMEAVNRMLIGTDLQVVNNEKSGILTVERSAPSEKNAQRAAQDSSDRPNENQKPEMGVVKLDTFEVMGSKLLNMDIRRTRDDTQPYVVFDRVGIEQSGALNVEDFLRQRLSMNASAAPTSQTATFAGGNTSSINLRGFGANQTLVLIDGHRAAGSQTSAMTPGQTDLNGIPLAMVERIEVLPTTASGIYGGGATGGVINVILRRDYSGAEIKTTYNNTFGTDSAARRVDFGAGFNLEDGKTNVLLAASYSDQNDFWVQDRNFVQGYREMVIANLIASPTALASNAPPLGATTNIRSVSGAPLFGPGTSNITFVPVGYTGGGGLAPLKVNAGKFNLAPADTAQFGTTGGGKRQGLGSVPVVTSASLTIRRQFTTAFQAFLELSASNNFSRGATGASSNTFTLAANAPNNPFGQAVMVAVPTPAGDGAVVAQTQNRRAVAGAVFKLAGEWKGAATCTWNGYRYNNSNPPARSTAGTSAVQNGSIDVLRDPSLVDLSSIFSTGPGSYTPPLRSDLRNSEVRVSGPLGQVPGGPMMLSGLLEYRDERFGDGYQISPTSTRFQPSRAQSLFAAYLETLLPLVSKLNRHPGLEELELQLAGRADYYRLDGAAVIATLSPASVIARARNREDSVNPTIGLKYRPFPDLFFRASFGKGFLPPTVNQLNSSLSTFTAGFNDPRRGNTPIPTSITLVQGGNANLRPEKSKSWSAGLVFTPKSLEGLRFSLDYTRIEKSDNIATLLTQQVIDNEALLPGRVERGPNLPSDLPGWAGPITAIDSTSVNLSRAILEAFDLAAEYHKELGVLGAVDLNAAITWTPHYRTQLISSVPEVENAGVSSSNVANANPRKLVANAGIDWRKGSWSAGWNARYQDAYLVVSPTLSTSAVTYLLQGSRYVSSQIYHDVFVAYHFGRAGRRWMHETDIQIGVRNVFNARPPLDVGNTQYLYSPLGDPRLANYYVSVRKAL